MHVLHFLTSTLSPKKTKYDKNEVFFLLNGFGKQSFMPYSYSMYKESYIFGLHLHTYTTYTCNIFEFHILLHNISKRLDTKTTFTFTLKVHSIAFMKPEMWVFI